MDLQRWDLNFSTVIHQVTKVEQAFGAAQRSEKRLLLQKKQAIVEYQLALAKISDRFGRTSKQKERISSHAGALIHWSEHITAKAGALYKRKSEYFGLAMWLQLIKTRLTGMPGQVGFMLDDSDLVKMGSRQINLKKTENLLGTRLVELKNEKTMLRERYEAVMTKQSNAMAARSLQAAFGSNLQESARHPFLHVFDRYFRWLTLPARRTTESEKHMQHLRSTINSGTSNIVRTCRDLVVENTTTSRIAIEEDTIRDVHKKLENLDHLQVQMEFANQQVMSSLPPALSPKVKGRLRGRR